MSQKTAIEWCDSTLNLVMGCDGCELTPGHCYAERLVSRYAGRKGWPKSFGRPEIFAERIEEARRWKDLTDTIRPEKPWLNGMPRLIFLNDLGDCFTESIKSLDWLADAVKKMEAMPHIFMLLTKRPERMVEFNVWNRIPRNIWCGATVTDQPTADERIPWLLECKAAVRFVSYEPALGSVDWKYHLGIDKEHTDLRGLIRLIIAGGETGPGARPSHPDWFRQTRDQCAAAGVPYFFKGWGEFYPAHETSQPIVMLSRKGLAIGIDGKIAANGNSPYAIMIPFGKKKSGRLLDGREHNELPE